MKFCNNGQIAQKEVLEKYLCSIGEFGKCDDIVCAGNDELSHEVYEVHTTQFAKIPSSFCNYKVSGRNTEGAIYYDDGAHGCFITKIGEYQTWRHS